MSTNFASANKSTYNFPLVTIIIITYNSSKYVIETLESAKSQTYQNIELIVADDCSSDNTVEICRKWIEDNRSRFVRTKIITVAKNTGIPGNCNRALHEAHGMWVKFIAGDDVLLDNTLSTVVNFFTYLKGVSIVHGRVIVINSHGIVCGKSGQKKKQMYPTFNEEFRSNKIQTPSVFFLKTALEKVGGFNENYKIEDIYIYLKILSEGMAAYFIDEPLVKYRIHDNNISSDSSLMLEEHLKILKEFKASKGYRLNYYIFCRNIILSMFYCKKISPTSLKLLSQNNFLLGLIFIDIAFYAKLAKIILKKYIVALEKNWTIKTIS